MKTFTSWSLKSFLLLNALFLNFACASVMLNGIDLEEVEKQLQSTGAEGEVHGAAHDYKQYVFSYRDPKDFFNAVQLPLLSRKEEIVAVLKTLQRHDRVKVWGEFRDLNAPQRHIALTKIEVVKKTDIALPEFHRSNPLPNDLKDKKTIKALVHAVEDEGRILVLDYNGSVVPLFTTVASGDKKEDKSSLAKDLYRNDSIEVDFVIQEKPKFPVHVRFNPESAQPLRVLKSLVKEHDQEGTREGSLVLFPKSPQVMFNVFALEYENEFGLKHNYTLINFEDKELFKKIREKLQAAWDAGPKDTIVNGRNKAINPKVRVRAKGKFNMVDAGQANPQIILDKIEDVEILAPETKKETGE